MSDKTAEQLQDELTEMTITAGEWRKKWHDLKYGERKEERKTGYMRCPYTNKCQAPSCSHNGPHRKNGGCHRIMTDCRYGVFDCIEETRRK